MKKSAGIVLYKVQDKQLQVLLAHPGGPFWKNKDAGAWTIPKGEFTDEEPLLAAIREFEEETGVRLSGDFIELRPVKLKSGKLIYAWALEGDLEVDSIASNEFEMEWPPHSGKLVRIPEIDRGAWFSVKTALEKINAAQGAFITELEQMVSGGGPA